MSRAWSGRIGLACVVLAALAHAAPPDPPIGDVPARELEEVRERLAARRERLAAALREEQDLLGVLEGLDHETRRARDAVRAAEAGVREAEQAQLEGDARAAALAERAETTRRVLAARAVDLYKEGPSARLRHLAGARNLGDLLFRARALRRAFEHDARLVARVREEQHEALRARETSIASASESARAARRLAARVGELEAEHGARRELLERLRSDGDHERKAMAELEAAASRLEETLRGLGARIPDAPAANPGEPFDARRGRLPPPVLARVSRSYGRVVDAQFRTATFRKGIDFAAAAGETVRAVAPGEVRFAGWFRGYGKMVIVDHGASWFTISAHLDEIVVEPGKRLSAGDPLGTVGETGSLDGPLLYFEIRRGSEPVDPSRWLAGVAGLR